MVEDPLPHLLCMRAASLSPSGGHDRTISLDIQLKDAEGLMVKGLLAQPCMFEGCLLELPWGSSRKLPKALQQKLAEDLVVEGLLAQPCVLECCFLELASWA